MGSWNGIGIEGSVFRDQGSYWEPGGYEVEVHDIYLADPDEFAEAGWSFLEDFSPGVERMVYAFQRLTGRFAPGVEGLVLSYYESELEGALIE